MSDEIHEVLKINIEVDQQRFKKMVTVDQLIGMQEGNLRSIRDVLSLFAKNGNGTYYETGYDLKFQRHIPNPAALALIGNMTMEQLMEASSTFLRNVDNKIVPPTNAPD